MKIRIENNRVFVDLVAKGCGVGCKYCYISAPSATVEPLTATELKVVLRRVEQIVHDSRNDSKPLLAIGCDTEIDASRVVQERANECLQFAQKHRLPLQIATKFPLSQQLLARLNCWPAQCPMPTVFTTITTVSLFRQLEPGAPPPAERARNFTTGRQRWLSYALVKPFLPASAKDSRGLLDLFLRSRPDGVVVGVHYRRGDHFVDKSKKSFEHPYNRDWHSSGLSQQAREFVSLLQMHDIRTFATTRCVTAWHNKTNHGQSVKRHSPELCVNCGACETFTTNGADKKVQQYEWREESVDETS
ncbi:MAG: hypothetical protein ACRER3_21860 [Pseudomonas fluorescens]